MCHEKTTNLSQVTEKQTEEDKLCVGHHYAPTNTTNNVNKT